MAEEQFQRLPDIPRLSPNKTKKFVIGFISLLLILSFVSVYFIQKGRNDEHFQAKLASVRQQLLPDLVTTEIPPRADFEEVSKKLRAFIEYQQKDKGIPAITISLIDDKQLVWSKGFGYAKENVPAMPQTVYRVASVSKLFTNFAIMQLVEEGKLNLDEPIQTYVPQITFDNPFDKAITLRQLMSHKSGLIREPKVGSYFDPTAPTLEKSIESIIGTPIVYQPETVTKYSNAAVMLLGYVIEKVSGESFPTYMKRKILEPLEMKDSSFEPEEFIKIKLADSFMWTYEGREFPAPVFEMGIGPAAGLYTTMPDLGRFMSMLFASGKAPNGESMLSKKLIESMWVPQFTTEKTGFGLGFFVNEFEGHKRVQHSGVQYGFATRFAALPDVKIGVSIASNLDNTNAVIDEIATYALKLMLAQKEQKELIDFQEIQSAPSEKLKDYQGYYSDGGKVVQLFNRDNNLYLDNETYQYKLGIRNDTLVTNSRLDMNTAIVRIQDGVRIGNSVYHRITPVEVTYPTRWKEYIGMYGWDHNILYIYPKNGKLYTLIEWFDSYPIEEQGKDQFIFPNNGLYMNEKIRFNRDTSMKINGVVAAQVFWKRKGDLPASMLNNALFKDDDSSVFKIKPIRSREEVRKRAFDATPPNEKGSFYESDLIEPARLDPTIKLDIRYASDRNFMGMVFYDQAKAFLQRPAAEALVRVNQALKERGYGLLIHDAYRPWYVTKMFWDATPGNQKEFVANPSTGSRHNRGCAVDLTLYDLRTGHVVEMPSLYDEFSERAYALYSGGTREQRNRRDILRNAMHREGFTVMNNEWWHFDYGDWKKYRIGNKRFEEL